MIKPDTYTTFARIFPGILSALPLFVLWYFVSQEPDWKGLLSFVISLKFVGAASISVVFLYAYSHFIRAAAKSFERKYFTEAEGFPTTYLMLYSDSAYSSDFKARFRQKAKTAFKLEGLDIQEEAKDPVEARLRLNEIFAQVRLKVGDGKLVAKHNVWYGFFRNLVGGSLFSAFFCAANVLIGFTAIRSSSLVTISVILLAAYLVIFTLRRKILIQNGEAYARQLISEFMAETSQPRDM